MDRSYKEVDLVHVHLERVQDPLIKVFSQVPYRVGGMDYYLYQDRLYYGYQQP
jgi:hypothetical protein